MKIVVIGGSGLIGSKVVTNLRQRGHEVVAASPSTGVNTLTGEGLAEALAGAQVVVDVANSPSFEDKPALEFFETSGRNLLAAEKTAGVKHHVALSVVGTDRLTGSGPGSLSGYFRAKMAQENLIKASDIPFTIVHATQFFEFVKNIAQSATDGSTVRLSSVLMQPIVSDDVAAAVADVALGKPMNGMIEVAGPDRIRQDELVRQYLSAAGDARKVITDVHAGYFGIEVNDHSLVPGNNPRLGPSHYKRLQNVIRERGHEQNAAVKRRRYRLKLVLAHPAGDEWKKRQPKKQMKISPHDPAADLAADVEEMMMVVPINPEVNEAEQISQKDREQRAQRVDVG